MRVCEAEPVRGEVTPKRNSERAEAAISRRSMGVFSIATLLAWGTSGCSPKNDGDSGEGVSGKAPVRIVTTCGMVTDIVKAVVGERFEVKGLLGEGVDPHLYQPGRNDSHALHEAHIVFYSGLMLEGGMERILKHAGERRPVWAVTDVLDRDYLRQSEEFGGHPDPHVWMDISAWSQCVGYISDRMCEFDPKEKSEYQRRASEYQAELSELNKYATTALATIPEDQRFLVTAHDAFGYFARAYGLQVRSVQGISTQSEAAVSDVNNLVAFIVEKKLPAIFVESSVPEKNIQAVVEGCASHGWKVQLGGTLYSDSMGSPGTYEGTYIGMMDHNVTTIVRSLGGQAPEGGWRGKLNRSEPAASAK